MTVGIGQLWMSCPRRRASSRGPCAPTCAGWIPACAGMTVWMSCPRRRASSRLSLHQLSRRLDSRLRGKDGLDVMPAKAGIQPTVRCINFAQAGFPPAREMTVWMSCPRRRASSRRPCANFAQAGFPPARVDSRLRGNDGLDVMPAKAGIQPTSVHQLCAGWIPACAGMTAGIGQLWMSCPRRRASSRRPCTNFAQAGFPPARERRC